MRRTRLRGGVHHCVLPQRANAASVRGIARALTALADAESGIAGDAALALRAQLHRNAESTRSRQGELLFEACP